MTSQPDNTTPATPEAEASGAASTVGAARKLQVRRAPKYVPFLIAGALAGVATAAIFTFMFPADEQFAASSVFGLFAVLLVLPGMGLGAVVALVLDRQGRKKSETLVVEQLPDDNGSASAETA